MRRMVIWKYKRKKEYKNIAYYKAKNIHFIYIRFNNLVIRFFGECQGPIWWFPKLEIYKKDKAIRIGWLWLAFGFGLNKTK
jgi:hypothetical protein